MRIYGYDINGAARGEIICSEVDAFDIKYGSLEGAAARLDWEACFTSLKQAKTALCAAMRDEGADTELISMVKTLKANDIEVSCP